VTIKAERFDAESAEKKNTTNHWLAENKKKTTTLAVTFIIPADQSAFCTCDWSMNE
jgi:hypothetical protein